MKKHTITVLVLAALSAGAGMYLGINKFATDSAQPAAVSGLFGQTLPDKNGVPHHLSEWRGKTLLVNFWATWCAPCVEEMPELNRLQTEVEKKNIQIIGIGVDSAANIKDFSSRLDIRYPLYVAGMGGADLSRQFGNQAGGLPFTVLIDSNGHIKKTYLGRLNLDEVRRELASP